jgi:hypothetical protein
MTKIVVRIHWIQTMKILLLFDQRTLIILLLRIVYQFEYFVSFDDENLYCNAQIEKADRGRQNTKHRLMRNNNYLNLL